MDVPGRIGSVNVEVGQNFGTLVVGDHNIVQLAGVAASVVVAQGPAQVHRPTDIPGFLDRRVETARVLVAVKPGAVFELVGVPKIGKTALARHAAQAGAGDFRDGALLLPPGLAGARDVLQSLFEIFYLATPELAPSATRLREYLAAKNALVVVDHCELSSRDLPVLLDAARDCAWLVAGAAPMLADATAGIALEGLPTDDALALMERVHGAPFTGALALQALAQCEALHGHPHAVMEAARRLAAAAPTGESSLAEDERALLSTLRLFAPRPVPGEVLPELSGLPRAVELAQALAARGLLRVDASGFQPMDSAQPEQPPDEHNLAARCDAVARVGKAAGANPARRRKLLAALPLLWSTLALASERAEWKWLLSLGAAWHAPLALGGRWDAWARLLDVHRQAARQLGDRAAEAWALHQAGTRELVLARFDAARSLFEQSLAACEPPGDAALQAATRQQLELVRTLAPVPANTAPDAAGQVPPTPVPAAFRWARLKTAALAGLVGVAVVGAALVWWLLGAPRLEVDVSSVDFEPVTLGAASAPASKPVRLRNSGRRALTLTGISAEAPFGVDASGCVAAPLAGGASCELRVFFAPGARGEVRGALAITAQGAGAAPVALAGRALAGELAVQSRVDFGAIDVGAPAASRRLVVENRGDAPLRVGPLPAPGAPFALAADGCRGKSLAPGANCSIELLFRATAPGRREATLVLSTDEPGAGPRSIALAGEGNAAAIELAPRELRFDAVEIGQRSAMQLLRVRNAGNAPLRLSVSPAGAGTAPFEVDAAGCAAAVAPGQACELRVVLAPGAAPGGARETTLKLAAPAVPAQTVRLSGRVAVPLLVLQPLAHDFGKVAWPPGTGAASAASQVFTIGNDGDAPLRIKGIAATPADFSLASNDCPAALPPRQRCRVAVRFAPAAAGRTVTGQLSASATHVPPAVAQLTGATLASPVPVPVLLSPTPNATLPCASDGRANVPFAWRIDPVPGASLRFRLTAGPGGATDANSTSATRSLSCPATVNWSVRAIAADGRTSDSETRSLTLVRRPVITITPPFATTPTTPTTRAPGATTPPATAPATPTTPTTRVPGATPPTGTTGPAATTPVTPTAPTTRVPGATTGPSSTAPASTTPQTPIRAREAILAVPAVKALTGSCCADTSGAMTRTTKAACPGRWWGPTETPPSTCVVIR